jgi:RNA polymerase sigma-70 factor (ECF subfamily)
MNAVPTREERVAVAFEQREASEVELLETLFRAHHDRVLRAAYRVTGSMHDAEDVAQTVFLRLAQNMGRAPIENAASYLYRAAINAALDVLRRREGERSKPFDQAFWLHTTAADASPEQVCSEAELRAWLRNALGRIGTRAAEMFVLHHLEGHDHREIARMLNTSRAVVAVILYRARVRLQRDFRREMRGER